MCRLLVSVFVLLLAAGCAQGRSAPPAVPEAMTRDSEEAVGEVRAALRHDDVVVLAIFTPRCPATAQAWDDLDALRSRLPTGVTVVGVREDEAAQKFVEQDDVERDLLAEQFDEKAQVTVPFLLVMDSGGIVRHVQTNYRGARDLTEVDGVVRSVRAMSDMR